jgi:hypothetical protein
VPTDAFERAHELVMAIGEHVHEAFLVRKPSPVAQRQHGPARHDRLDDALVCDHERGLRSRTQRAVAGIDGGEPVGLQCPEGRPTQAAAPRRRRGGRGLADGVAVDHDA